MTEERTVLVILPMGNGMAQTALSGIRAASAARGWHILTAETERAADGSLRIERSSGSVATVGEFAALMRPDGVIVWGYALSPDEVAAHVGSVPVVFIDPPFGDASSGRHQCAVVRGDAKSVASLAARELLIQDVGDLVFVPSEEDESWNWERREAFRDCARVAGTRYHQFEWKREKGKGKRGHPSLSTGGSRTEALRRWLAALPKPCGVFAANDKTGDEVLVACAAQGIAVPQDASVVGVDNLVYLCESTSPTLSSITMNHRREGIAAAELLARWMDAPDRPPPSRAIPAMTLVRRASSRPVRDRRVAKAQEAIRLHACEESFNPRAAIREMGVCRSHGFALFRSVTGHTILDEIHGVRLARAKEMLADGAPPDAVASACGYASHADFRRVFQRYSGVTVRQWIVAQHRGQS